MSSSSVTSGEKVGLVVAIGAVAIAVVGFIAGQISERFQVPVVLTVLVVIGVLVIVVSTVVVRPMALRYRQGSRAVDIAISELCRE
jgi:uncharacterized membrane protein (UPF0136 family)